jgi:hypothetical protein
MIADEPIVPHSDSSITADRMFFNREGDIIFEWPHGVVHNIPYGIAYLTWDQAKESRWYGWRMVKGISDDFVKIERSIDEKQAYIDAHVLITRGSSEELVKEYHVVSSLQAGQPLQPIRWEYKRQTTSFLHSGYGDINPDVLGDQGWELVTVLNERTGNHFVWIYKRPKGM